MCPACLTTMALWAAGASSAGGLGWLVLRRLHPEREADTRTTAPQENRVRRVPYSVAESSATSANTESK